MAKKIFLESHNLKNPFFGFGQFNAKLIEGFFLQENSDFKFTIHTKDSKPLKKKYGSFFSFKKYFSLRRYPFFSISKKYDIWHSLNQNTKIEPKHNIPYLLTIHDVNFIDEVSSDMNHDCNVRFQSKLNRATAITYISEYAKYSTHQYFKIPKIPEYIIYNGNPITSKGIPKNFRPNFSTTQPYLFSVGTLTPRKNTHVLVEMLSKLENFHLILAGDHETDYCENILKPLVRRLQLDERVHLVGKVSEDEKKYYYKNCVAFVFPSLREGFGFPPIEAMTYGKPIFLSKNTSLPEIGGNHSFYWENFDAIEMSNILLDGLKKYEDKEDFYKNWYKSRAASFSWTAAAKQYLEVYESML